MCGVIRYSGGSSRHGIAYVGQLQHFQIIVLISECDTILWIHAKGRYDIGKSRTLVGIRCNEINPDIPGGYNLDSITETFLKIGAKTFFSSVKITYGDFDKRFLDITYILDNVHVITDIVTDMIDVVRIL